MKTTGRLWMRSVAVGAVISAMTVGTAGSASAAGYQNDYIVSFDTMAICLSAANGRNAQLPANTPPDTYY
ncbi:hypothetical protein [Micromonospora fluostatini]|uniref:hypothetical protein n=1 Tax=Micromonospora sp. JCM 30529 TaxID=3421643 RepID=UPI003D16343C